VLQDGWRVILVVDDQVKISIVVQISERHTAARALNLQPSSGNLCHVLESPVAQASVKQIALAIRCRQSLSTRLGIHMSIRNKDVRPAIVVEIEKSSAPAQILQLEPQFCVIGLKRKGAVAVVAIERRDIILKVRF